MPTRRWALSILIALLTMAAGLPAQSGTHVVLISIDGMMPTVYRQPGPPDVPTLRRLAGEGASARGVVGVLPSNTFPTHTTLISGVRPAVHGIIDNAIVDPEGRSRGGWNWYASDVRVPTLLSAARAAGLHTAAINWPVTIGLDADLVIPDFQPSGHPDSLKLLRALSSPELFEAAEGATGASLPWPVGDRAWTAMAQYAIGERDSDLTLVHLLALDGAQHAFGVGSAEARAALAAIDGEVARVLDTVRASGAADRTYVIVVSDHGFANIERTLRLNALFREEGLLDVDAAGRINRWDAYFHPSGGSGFVYLASRGDATTRARVEALLARLQADPDRGIAVVWNAEALAGMAAHPDAAFGVGMKPGWYTSGATDAITGPPPSRGGHGFPPDYPELHASLIVSGPGIAPGQDLGLVRMTQVGPTIAALLGLELSPDADEPLDVRRTP